MKYLLVLLSFWSFKVCSQTSIYRLNLTGLDRSTIRLADFKGKKVLISLISPDNLQKTGLRLLDSLQDAYPNLKVIVLPIDDYGGTKNDQILESVRDNSSKRVFVASLASGKKEAGGRQHTLAKWLTTAADNVHFDAEANTDDQMYIVSESGILYARLEKGTSRKFLQEALEQPESSLPEFKKR